MLIYLEKEQRIIETKNVYTNIISGELALFSDNDKLKTFTKKDEKDEMPELLVNKIFKVLFRDGKVQI